MVFSFAYLVNGYLVNAYRVKKSRVKHHSGQPEPFSHPLIRPARTKSYAPAAKNSKSQILLTTAWLSHFAA
jgi:hypothetical protein